MKSMKGLSVNKVLGSIRKKANSSSNRSDSASGATPSTTPEATAHNSVKAFCESGGKGQNDEVLFLPPIVDAAESSPGAASECARIIRKYLSRDYMSRPSWQYNAIMLMRILTDNPGATFTRNIDQKFVDTTRMLLRNCKDRSVRQLLMETLDDFEHTKLDDENLTLIVSMWKEEKQKAYQAHNPHHGPMASPGAPLMSPAPSNPHSQNYFARNHTNRRLPDPVELASRLEEARTTAKLLEQVVMNTQAAEIIDNDLIKEFADRCLSASRSIQGYMTSENPCPDNDTMESLIDTNEQLQTALNQHKRAVLSARKQLGLGLPTSPNENSMTPPLNGANTHSERLVDDTAPSASGGSYLQDNDVSLAGKGKHTEVYPPPPGPPPSGPAGSISNRPVPKPTEDPFADPVRDPQQGAGSSSAGHNTHNDYDDGQRLAYEPYHPGFRPTESYIGRQDSAIGKVHMHGAGTSTPSGEPKAHQRLDEVSDDDDIYDAPPKSKEPIHRY